MALISLAHRIKRKPHQLVPLTQSKISSYQRRRPNVFQEEVLGPIHTRQYIIDCMWHS